jgi:hypothetical protein
MYKQRESAVVSAGIKCINCYARLEDDGIFNKLAGRNYFGAPGLHARVQLHYTALTQLGCTWGRRLGASTEGTVPYDLAVLLSVVHIGAGGGGVLGAHSPQKTRRENPVPFKPTSSHDKKLLIEGPSSKVQQVPSTPHLRTNR